MPSILDFFRRLFSKRKPAARPAAMSFGGAEPASEALIESPPPPPPPPPILVTEGRSETETEDDDEDEVDDLPAEEEADDDDPLAPDPFVSPDAPPIAALSVDAVTQQRAAALARALTGEHRVFLAEPAGPGTLAEALNLLAREGKVSAEFRDDADEGPYLLYRAVADGFDPPGPTLP